MTVVVIATPAGQGIAEQLRQGFAGFGDAEVLAIAEDELRAALAARLTALAQAKTIGLIVLALIPQDAVAPRAITDISPIVWRSACMCALKLTLRALQASHDALAARGGTTIVVLGPHFALSGAARLAPLTTLAEGQRALAKTSARQFAAAGFRIHWAGLRAGQFHPALDDVMLPRKADLTSVALNGAPPMDSIARTLAFLASDAARGSLTGVTLMLDGGEWMAP